MSHPTLARMSKSRPAAIEIVAAFLVGAIAPDYSLRTIRKDYPSGAAAKVSHNRPVRMSESRPVAIAIVTAFLVGTFAPNGGLHTIHKDYPSEAAAKVSHNRPVRMFPDQSPQLAHRAGGGVRSGPERVIPGRRTTTRLSGRGLLPNATRKVAGFLAVRLVLETGPSGPRVRLFLRGRIVATTAIPTSRPGCAWRRARPDREGNRPVYKLLLCVRYLQTRYLAFICIVSVMLGVATLIVVNSVMSGFSTKLKDRLHGMLSDIVVDTDRIDGLYVFERKEIPDGVPMRPLNTDQICDLIMASPVGERIEAIAPTIEVFAIMQFPHHGQTQTKPIRLIGVDPTRRAAVGGFSEYLVRQRGAVNPSFELTPEALQLHDWNVRRQQREDALAEPPPPLPLLPIEVRDPNAPLPPPPLPPPDMQIDKGMPTPKLHGMIPGYTLAHFRYRNQQGVVMEEVSLEPGDSVTVTTIGGAELKPVWGTFLVADYIKTEMSEYDQSCVYVPLEQLQKIRGMQGRCTALQIKLKNYDKDKEIVASELKKLLGETEVRVATWEENQGPLLAAIDVERGILNLLLFMIVGVAGFSILAIFTMIVSEKYRDIGILKSLGASSCGVLSIFLGYGLLLGTVGVCDGHRAGVVDHLQYQRN